MVIKLNSYALPEDVVTKMMLKIEETKQRNIELGFGLCRMKYVNTLKPGHECEGNECSIVQMPECPTGLYIGGYHTHPEGPAEPSIADLKNAYINDVECVGSAQENAVRCFVRMGYRKPQDEKYIIDKFKEVEEPFSKSVSNEQYQRWKNARDEILNKHFQAVDVR
jgi:hypothetical protein